MLQCDVKTHRVSCGFLSPLLPGSKKSDVSLKTRGLLWTLVGRSFAGRSFRDHSSRIVIVQNNLWIAFLWRGGFSLRVAKCPL